MLSRNNGSSTAARPGLRGPLNLQDKILCVIVLVANPIDCGVLYGGMIYTLKAPTRFLAGLLTVALVFLHNTPISHSQESSDIKSETQTIYSSYSERLRNAENLLKTDHSIKPEDVTRLETWLGELENTPYKDLIAKARMLVFLTREKLASSRSRPGAQPLDGTPPDRTRPDGTPPDTLPLALGTGNPGHGREIAQWVTFSVGISCLGLFNLFWYMGDRSYEEFLEADSASEEKRLQEITGTYDTLSYVFAGVGLVSLGVWIYLLATGPVSDRPNPE